MNISAKFALFLAVILSTCSVHAMDKLLMIPDPTAAPAATQPHTHHAGCGHSHGNGHSQQTTPTAASTTPLQPSAPSSSTFVESLKSSAALTVTSLILGDIYAYIKQILFPRIPDLSIALNNHAALCERNVDRLCQETQQLAPNSPELSATQKKLAAAKIMLEQALEKQHALLVPQQTHKHGPDCKH